MSFTKVPVVSWHPLVAEIVSRGSIRIPRYDPAVKRAWFLRYAALQFVVLTAVAMHFYADGYHFTTNFFSELGMTTTWWGRPNHVSAALFSIALATLGIAFIAFATTDGGRVTRAFGMLSGWYLATASRMNGHTIAPGLSATSTNHLRRAALYCGR